MVCLDTDVIINFLRNQDESVSFISFLIKKGETFSTTSINEFELWKGIFKSKSSELPVKRFIENVSILQFESKASKKAAEIYDDLAKKGETVDVLDVMIAAICIVNDEAIFTKNKKHFERISGIKFFKD